MTLVTISAGDYDAAVDPLGGGLHSLRHRGRALTTTPSPGDRPGSWDGAVLAPWPNRIDHGRYRFRGVQFDVTVNEPERDNALHGSVWSNAWEVVEHRDDTVRMRTHIAPSAGYPWAIGLELTYSVGDGGLTLRAGARNLGGTTAPFGFGVHPYVLAPAGDLDLCDLTFTAARQVVTDERLIPVGEHANASTSFDFATPRPIDGTELDTAFGGLARDARGFATLTLMAPDGAGSVSCWWDASYPWLQLYTPGRGGANEPRQSIAVEPMSCPPDAFNSGIDVVELEPGGAWSGTLGVSAGA